MSHFLIHAARMQDAGVTKLFVTLHVGHDNTRLMRVEAALSGGDPEADLALVARFPARTFELCGTDRLLEQLQDEIAFSAGGATPEKLAAAIAKHPQAADDLREWYAYWLLTSELSDDDISAAESEVSSESTARSVSWIKGLLKGMDVARKVDAAKAKGGAA